MMQLVRKDFILITKSYLLFIACMLFISVLCLNLDVDAGGIYIFSALLAFFIMGIGNLVSDHEQDAAYFLLTLPVSRNGFVLSKYMSGLIVAILSWFTTSLVLLICLLLPISFRFTGLSIFLGLSWSVGIIVIVLSIILPVYYAFGNKAIRWLIIIPLLLASFSSQFVHSSLFASIVSGLSHYSTEYVLSVFLIISLVIYALSCIISLVVVSIKDF
ncbi:magnesium-transporting ATPase (P-type) [Virgibacillus halotolerans]|nr:magnesium-transporting ATPase (P-type) [Virgibacillus halotolerans]